MKRRNATRNALFTSVISLLLCVSMLVGTTFAWFTDEVKSGMNNITAGNLDIELEYSKDANTWNTVKDATDLFGTALWEPGHTEVVYLRLSNLGTLALNYQLGINVASETAGTNVAGKTFKLSDYIKFGVVEGQSIKFADRAAAVAAVTDAKALNAGYTKATGMNAGDVTYMALVVYMPETVGNEANYRGTAPEINLGINVLASQKTQESDSFGPNYDLLAQGGYVSEAAPAAGETKEYPIMPAAETTGEKIGTMNISSDSVEDLTKPVEISVVPTEQDTTVTVEEDEKALSFEITVTNIKEDNTTPIKVELNVGKGLSGVKVYHKGTEITDVVYNSNTGYVTFYTTSFSPYTVVFYAEYNAPVVDEPTESNLPKANVVYSPEHVNSSLAFGNYGQWSPTPGLEAKLESVYTFSCVDTLEQAKNSPYANWYCDFYVMLDKDLGENEIFLGGNYGSFGWVGFHNGDTTLEANTEIGLLESVTTNPWTYLDVVQNVGTFICGVGDVNDALAGATFTVMLRLTNPADENDFKNVEKINYTFPAEKKTYVSSSEELAAAVAAGQTDIYLNDGEYNVANCGGKTLTINGSKNAVLKVYNEGEAGCDYGFDGSSVTFNGVTFDTSVNNGSYKGYARMSATYNNCTFNGSYALNANSVFENCSFNVSGDAYNIWTWGAPAATFNGCTFNSDGKAVLLYGAANTKLTLNNCVFNDNGGLTDLKAAVEIGNDYGSSYELIVNNTTVNGYEINDKGINTGTTLWGNKNSMGADKLNVVVDGVDVY